MKREPSAGASPVSATFLKNSRLDSLPIRIRFHQSRVRTTRNRTFSLCICSPFPSWFITIKAQSHMGNPPSKKPWQSFQACPRPPVASSIHPAKCYATLCSAASSRACFSISRPIDSLPVAPTMRSTSLPWLKRIIVGMALMP